MSRCILVRRDESGCRRRVSDERKAASVAIGGYCPASLVVWHYATRLPLVLEERCVDDPLLLGGTGGERWLIVLGCRQYDGVTA